MLCQNPVSMTSVESNISNFAALHTQTNSPNMPNRVHVDTVNHSLAKRFKLDPLNLNNDVNNNSNNLKTSTQNSLNAQLKSQLPLQAQVSDSSGASSNLKKLYIVSYFRCQ